MSILFSNANPQNRMASAPIIAQIDPPVSGPAMLQYPIGTFWINTVSNVVFALTSVSNGQAFWQETVAGAPGVFTDLSVTPGPTAIDGEFRVNGNVDEAEVIRLREDGGTSGSIEIASLQGTGADSISISSGAGGIEIATAAAGGDILVSSALGSIGIVAGEDVLTAIIIQADGGTSSGLLIENTSGTGSGSSTSSAIGILATDGAVYVESQGAFNGAIVLDATDAAGGMLLNSGTGGIDLTSTGDITSVTTLGDVDLTADAGDVNIEATLGALNFTAGGGISYSVTGAINLDATADSHFTVTGAGADLLLSSAGGRVNLDGSQAIASAITINASDAAGGIDVNSGTGGVDIDTTGAFSIDGSLASNVTTTGAAIDLTLSSVLGSVNVLASEVAADAIVISATGASAGIQIAPAATVASIAIGNVTPTVARTTTVNGFVVNSAVADTLNLATGGVSTNAGASKVINVATGNNLLGTTTLNLATGTAASGTKTVNVGNVDALTAVNAFGVVGINNSTSAGATTIGTTATGGAVAINSATAITSLAANVNVNNSGTGATTIGSATGGTIIARSNTAAANAIQINASNATGGIDIDALAGGITMDTTAAISLDSVTASNFTVTGAADLTVRSTAGAVVVSSAKAGANAIQLNCSDVAATISATMSAGSVTISNTGKVTVTGDDLEVATAARGVILGSGTKVIDGAGSPNASVSATKGSLYLATNGSGVADRLYINTDGATAWTAITTVS